MVPFRGTAVCITALVAECVQGFEFALNSPLDGSSENSPSLRQSRWILSFTRIDHSSWKCRVGPSANLVKYQDSTLPVFERISTFLLPTVPAPLFSPERLWIILLAKKLSAVVPAQTWRRRWVFRFKLDCSQSWWRTIRKARNGFARDS
jgi:hypothetical protein